MAKIKIEIEAVNERCKECPHLNIEVNDLNYINGCVAHREILCRNYNTCKQAITNALADNSERSDNNGKQKT